jgi:D-3-phosphoglycerate dehydrogenase
MAIEPREALITDAVDVLAPMITHLEEASVNVRFFDNSAPPEEIVDCAANVPVIVIGGMHFGAPEIRRFHKTGLMIRAGVGYDVIDVDAATSAGVWVANVPDFCVEEVADHTMLLILGALRRLPESMSTWRERRSWHVTATLPQMRRLDGLRLGLVGLGRIGGLVAQRAAGFGMNVISYDPFLADDAHRAAGSTPVSMDELLETADVVSLHCPLTTDNIHLMNASSLARVKPGVVIVNTSRGALIDLDALDDALDSGLVGYAALDVLDGEPTPDLDHPLLSRPNALITSHTAWYSVEASRQLSLNAAREAIRFLDGQAPLHLINPGARTLSP